ncbi:hypothetical protein Y032_0015g2665 [Ancylostoma ceylanicum]|uniref:Uncharacterized protein n=1 Tax=Ancylostoma ceylanicum TaxID=53326 RepID=A0A016V877_9BILA|nr:hypothetical protein Y032_0015g2665 [Ancylostoma ceylanicum]
MQITFKMKSLPAHSSGISQNCNSISSQHIFSWSPRSKRLQSQKSPRSHHATQSQGLLRGGHVTYVQPWR